MERRRIRCGRRGELIRRGAPPLAIFGCLVLALGALQSGCASKARVSDQPSPGIAYQASFAGVDDARLLDLLRSVSACVELSEKPVASIFQLRARARADVVRLRDALRSQGMLAAAVTYDLDQSATPVMVRFTVRSMEMFHLDAVTVVTPDGVGAPEKPLPQAADLGLVPGSPALSKDIIAAAEKLLGLLRNNGHPFPALVKQDVVADFKTRLVRVAYIVDPGPPAVFGPVKFTGLKDVRESFLAPLVSWRQGDPYQEKRVSEFQTRLLNLGLFSTAEVVPEKTLDNGRAIIAVTVTERKKRTIKAGLNYRTDVGPGANLFWEHRNLFGSAEKLRLNLVGSQVEQLAEAFFEKPSFLSPRQRLLASLRVGNQNTDAYKGQFATIQAGLSRKVTDALSVNAGLGYRESRIESDAANPQESNKRWGLVFIPVEGVLDTRDDVLDPQKGFLLGLKVAPYLDTRGRNLNFFTAELNGSVYLRLLDKPSLVWAVRAGVGTIQGANAKDVPSDVRFYAGGGATIRGYGFQTVGPLRGTKPLGGGSLVSFGNELRVQMTERVGLAVFLDGGNVFSGAVPDVSKGLLYGFGLGVRIKSPVGPLRVDVATPLQHRSKVDSPIQLYIGIGQAF